MIKSMKTIPVENTAQAYLKLLREMGAKYLYGKKRKEKEISG